MCTVTPAVNSLQHIIALQKLTCSLGLASAKLLLRKPMSSTFKSNWFATGQCTMYAD